MLNRRDFVKLSAWGSLSFGSSSDLLAQAPIRDGTFYSAPPAAFDPVMGYRWLPGPTRVVRVINSELIVDSVFGGNSHGYNCSYSFTPKKPTPRTFRFLVLGDSFTAGLNMLLPWPERLQQLLRSRRERWREVQVYPFPIDGGGLLNWYSVFMNQVLPQFEFDALIIASWYENLARKFIVFHADRLSVYLQRFDYDERPRSREAFEKIRPGMQKLFEVRNEREIDQLVARVKQETRPAPVSADHYCRQWTAESEIAPPGYTFSAGAFTKRYGAERLALFTEIAEACRKLRVPVIFCSVPTRQGLLRIRKGSDSLLHRSESEGLCQHFGLHYFDGYAIFEGIDAEAIAELYWLKYDGHWGLAASDLFALKLAEWITRHNIIPLA